MPRLAKYEIEALARTITKKLEFQNQSIKDSSEYRDLLEQITAELKEEESDLFDAYIDYEEAREAYNQASSKLTKAKEESNIVNIYVLNNNIMNIFDNKCIEKADKQLNIHIPSMNVIKDEITIHSVEGTDDIINSVIESLSE